MRHGIVLAACALAQLASLTARADNWVIEHVTLIDGIHEPQSDMTVAIEGDRIIAVTPSAIARGLKGRRIAGNGKSQRKIRSLTDADANRDQHPSGTRSIVPHLQR